MSFFFGSLSLLVVLAFIGVSAYMQWSKSVFGLIIAFVCLYNATNGSQCWLYVHEVCSDRAI